ncbi:18845_t:CDS:1, partial [Funneliformis geosporum]
AAKIASKGFVNIIKYFDNSTSTSFTSLLNDRTQTIADDLIDLEKIIEKQGFNLALEKLNTLIKDKSLISQ